MYKNKKILAFIPARIESKRIPKKNIQMLNGKPLFMYSVDVAKQSKYIDNVLVSTDSSFVKKMSVENGCLNGPLRPQNLAGDHSRIIDSILYEIEENNLKVDVVVLLQPTFPFRNSELVDGAIEQYFNSGETSVITVTEVKENPVFMRRIDDNGKLEKIINQTSDIRSQDFSKYFRIAGSVYVNNFALLNSKTVLNENEVPYIISEEYSLDIDTFEDLARAREIFKEK